jgi:flagellar basal body-associated protein FliL
VDSKSHDTGNDRRGRGIIIIIISVVVVVVVAVVVAAAASFGAGWWCVIIIVVVVVVVVVASIIIIIISIVQFVSMRQEQQMRQGGSPGTPIRFGLPIIPCFATARTISLTFIMDDNVVGIIIARDSVGQQRAPSTRLSGTFSKHGKGRIQEDPPQGFETARTGGKTGMNQQVQGFGGLLNHLGGNQGMMGDGAVFVQNVLECQPIYGIRGLALHLHQLLCNLYGIFSHGLKANAFGNGA